MSAELLGSHSFKRAYGLKYAYVGGAMYKGIASADMVISLAQGGYLGFLGSGGLSDEALRGSIDKIQSVLRGRYPFGVNFLCQLEHPEREAALVDCLIEKGVNTIEAAAFAQITESLVKFRCLGLYRDAAGCVASRHRVMAKISRPEVLQVFLRPAPQKYIDQLLSKGEISSEQAQLAANVPMADDICCEADSGGHTDQAVITALLPAMCRMKTQYQKALHWTGSMHIGVAGGLGSPEAIAAAYMLGADFVLLGSVHQCTVEAGTSAVTKALLAKADFHETGIAPAGDMFEYGAKVQVLTHGTLFQARANKLYELYRFYNSIDDIPVTTRTMLEEKLFQQSIDDIWIQTKAYLARNAPEKLQRAEQHPKTKMALIFRWYFFYATQIAMEGRAECQANFQIQCGPAMGAFNAFVRGSVLEPWQNRHVCGVADALMQGAAKHFASSVRRENFEEML